MRKIKIDIKLPPEMTDEWLMPTVTICCRKIGEAWCVGSLSEEGTEQKQWRPIRDFATEKEAKKYLDNYYQIKK